MVFHLYLPLVTFISHEAQGTGYTPDTQHNKVCGIRRAGIDAEGVACTKPSDGDCFVIDHKAITNRRLGTGYRRGQ